MLRLLFLAGWVHRDISSGDILLYQSNNGPGQGKIGDLEYAKEFVDETDHSAGGDPKTVRDVVHLWTPFEFIVFPLGNRYFYGARNL